MEKTHDGDLLFAYNANIYSSRVTNESISPGQIDLIVVPKGDFSVVNKTVIPLVEEVTASYSRLLKDGDDNLFLFWFDQRTGSTHLYLKHCVRPDITVEIDPDDWALARFIRPNETKVVPLRARNIGTVRLVCDLMVDSNASQGWKLQLDHERAVLGVAQTVYLNLTVHCPADAELGSAVEIWVTADSVDQDTKARLRLVMIVYWKRSLDAQCQPSYSIVDPGESTTYTVVLINLGDLREDIVISVQGVGPLSWTYTPDGHETSLDPGETEEFQVTVVAPADAMADDSFITLVDFDWDEGGSAHSTLHLRTVVNPTFYVTLELNRTNAVVLPAESAAFCVTVGNVGNMNGTAYIEVELVSDSRDWLITISSSSVILEAGAQEDLVLKLTAPSDATWGEIMVVKVRAFSAVPFSEAVREARAEVGAIHGLEWSPSVLEWRLDPSMEGSAEIVFSNGGNLLEVIGFLLDDPSSDWHLTFEEGGVEIDSIDVRPCGQRNVTVRIRVPADATAGHHTLRLHIEASGATVGHVDLVVTVNHLRAIEVTVNGERNDTFPGGTIELRVDVTNMGNGGETVLMDASGTWLESYRFIYEHVNVTTVWLPRGRTVSYLLWARVSQDAPAGVHHLEVVVTSSEDASCCSRDEGEFDVHVPSLEIVMVEVTPSHVEVGEIVTIRLVLQNPGCVEVVGVVVSMENIEEESIASIAPGAEAVAVFTWIAVDPGVKELHGDVKYGPGDHQIEWSCDVEVGDTEVGPSHTLLMLLVLVLLLVASALVLITLRSKPGAE